MARKTSDASRRQIIVLFADICDSYGLYRDLGDASASAIVSEFLSHLELPVRGHGGQIVDHIGDELMCAFTNRSAAIRAAVEMQFVARNFAHDRPDVVEVSIRIGMDSGAGLEQNGKPVGDPVYVANRLTDQAKAGQILLSEAAVVNLDMEIEFRFLETLLLKGSSDPTSIYEVVWDGSDSTDLFNNDNARPPTVAARLELDLPDHSGRIIFAGQSITIGRIAPADVVVKYKSVSRLHARIESRRGRFTLTDMSTNGTFVRTSADREARYVRRDDIELTGNGIIGLGGAPQAGEPNTLTFRCIVE